MREFTTKCDVTGKILEENGIRTQGFLSLKGGIAYQHQDGGFDYLGNKGAYYYFSDEDCLAYWIAKQIDSVSEMYERKGPYWERNREDYNEHKEI